MSVDRRDFLRLLTSAAAWSRPETKLPRAKIARLRFPIARWMWRSLGQASRV